MSIFCESSKLDEFKKIQEAWAGMSSRPIVESWENPYVKLSEAVIAACQRDPANAMRKLASFNVADMDVTAEQIIATLAK